MTIFDMAANVLIMRPTKPRIRFMDIMPLFSERRQLLLLMLGFVFITACTGKSWFSYTGWETKPENRYVLRPGGPHAVIWKSADLHLEYRYRLEGNRLDVEGKVVRQNRIKHFEYLSAWVNVHMLDADGIVIDTHRLWSQNGSTVLVGLRWEFKKSWQLPPNNKAIGFSFSGTAGHNDVTWDFWQAP